MYFNGCLNISDARKKHEYNESHVVTAKKAPKSEEDEFVVPYDSELECKQHVIIYDSNTRSLKDEGSVSLIFDIYIHLP